MTVLKGVSAFPITPSDADGRVNVTALRNCGKYHSMIPAYKTVSIRDLVYQPGASTTNPTMGNDMVCHVRAAPGRSCSRKAMCGRAPKEARRAARTMAPP
jgi:hypothetical protein